MSMDRYNQLLKKNIMARACAFNSFDDFHEAYGLSEFVWYWMIGKRPKMAEGFSLPVHFTIGYWEAMANRSSDELKNLINDIKELGINENTLAEA